MISIHLEDSAPQVAIGAAEVDQPRCTMGSGLWGAAVSTTTNGKNIRALGEVVSTTLQ